MPSTTLEQSLGCLRSLNKRMLLAIIPEEEQPSHPGGTDSNRRSVQLVTKGLKRTPKTKRRKKRESHPNPPQISLRTLPHSDLPPLGRGWHPGVPTKSYKAISRFKNSDMDAVMDNGLQFPPQKKGEREREILYEPAAYLACNLLRDGEGWN
ncbi:hypothetical protein TNIN_372861 [Trichonephila inaurata madagascariensis]|uniref:Uncharacterized protein n=1 Tax=Trichonephila inaurata madagascariensis TaxID=2747483 RepID=A0A8X6YBK7_9ARAC|nr:hypothetical protein TNIN_372861 [Trichonephila inaurata madagascariensis]